MKKGQLVTLVLIVAAAVVAGIVWAQSDKDGNSTSTNSTLPDSSSDGSPQDGDPSSSETEGDVTITYDGSGFSPSTVTVKAGDTVTFRNESTTEVWPASDVHPTHNDLPGFDALGGLGQGEEYSFTFDEAGEWNFHNHLNSAQGGTITVE